MNRWQGGSAAYEIVLQSLRSVTGPEGRNRVAKFGVAALEDDAIYVAIVEGDKDGFGKLADVRQYARPPRGYSNDFIRQIIHQHFAPFVAAREIICLGISSFGLVLAVPSPA